MKEILLCSHNPLLIKNIYGILLDEGCNIEIADHPSLAVRMVLEKKFDALIIDCEPFGLSGEDAVKIIKSILPDIPILSVGPPVPDANISNIDVPLDLEKFKQSIYDILRFQSFN